MVVSHDSANELFVFGLVLLIQGLKNVEKLMKVKLQLGHPFHEEGLEIIELRSGCILHIWKGLIDLH